MDIMAKPSSHMGNDKSNTLVRSTLIFIAKTISGKCKVQRTAISY
jgi:hypothetical protein